MRLLLAKGVAIQYNPSHPNHENARAREQLDDGVME
jgi:hypothetical protein